MPNAYLDYLVCPTPSQVADAFGVNRSALPRLVIAIAENGVRGGGDVAAIPDNPDEVPDAPSDASLSGETIESHEVHDQARGYLGEDDEVESEEDPETAADKRVAAKKAAKAKADAGDEVDGGEDESEKKVERRGRESAKYKELAEKTAAYEKRFEQFERHVASIQSQAQQQVAAVERQRHETEKALAVATKELEIIRAKAEQQEEAGLDDLEKFRRKILRETEGVVGKKYESKFEEYERRFADQERVRAQEKREAEINRRMAGYERDADMAVSELLKGRDPAKANALSPKTKTALLNYAAAHNLTPRAAAQEMKQWAYDFVLSGMKAKNVVNKERTTASKKIPAANPAGKAPAKGAPRPTHAQAKKRGMSALEAMVEDNPPAWAKH